MQDDRRPERQQIDQSDVTYLNPVTIIATNPSALIQCQILTGSG